MHIHVTTFAGRKVHYIQETLGSLLVSDWARTGGLVHLIMGSEDESHVREFAPHPLVRIVPWDVQPEKTLRLNCTLNKIRALRHGGDGPLLICEDDVRFPRAWVARLRRAAAELEGEEYVLSLFTSIPDLEQAPLVSGKEGIKQYPFPTLQGAHALFYPSKAIRERVADYLEENLREGCGDDLIGRYARQYAALYATKTVLVDNVGAVSCFH